MMVDGPSYQQELVERPIDQVTRALKPGKESHKRNKGAADSGFTSRNEPLDHTATPHIPESHHSEC